MPGNVCRVCKRPLKNQKSVMLGIGPVCRGKGVLDEKYYQGEFFMVEAIPDFTDVFCSRDENGVHTNVPRRIIKHSPTGFDWGYAGSGPADFALNILSVFLGEEKARRGGLYQSFNFDFIVKLPPEGGIIKKEAIINWIDKKKAAL